MDRTKCLEYFNGEELPTSIFFDKYALRDSNDNIVEETPDDMHRRMAREFARIEKKKFGDKAYTEDFIYDLFFQFKKLIPQGSPMYGIGNPKPVSLSNCYVIDTGDSYGHICNTDQQLAQLSKRRSGVGVDISSIRPVEMLVNNSSRSSTGIVPFAERFSSTIREVSQLGRRGALLISLSVHHPEIKSFCRMKLDPTKVTGANVSIRLTDEFLEAVKNNTDYEQRWPVDSKAPVVSKMVNARELWQEIIFCAWSRAEPGLLFWDTIIRESPADCYEDYKTKTTNPCGEIPLCEGDSCRLLVVNLFSCVVNPYTKDAYFDFELFKNYSYIAQRLMDDLVDLEIECITKIIQKVEDDPEPQNIKQIELDLWNTVLTKCKNGRRTGLGQTGIGDTMAAIGIKYGSNESIAFTGEIYKNLMLSAYRSSIDMAKELGAFPVWDWDKEKDNSFLYRIGVHDPLLYEDMRKYGRRNIALLTTAPVGTTSQLAKLSTVYGTTSGIEPMFTCVPYQRRKKINHADKIQHDFVDEVGDKWKTYDVYPGGVKQWMEITGETDYTKSPYHGCCANDLDWKQRVRLQAAGQKFLCHSVSSTLNLPHDVTVSKVAEIYEEAWKAGLKGITVYRDGCRDGILLHKEEKKPVKDLGVIPETVAPKRPVTLDCSLYRAKLGAQTAVAVIGLLNDKPYEIFILISNDECRETVKLIPRDATKGKVFKSRRGEYTLKIEGNPDIPKINHCLSDEQAAITRLISTSLRHGTPIQFILSQLDKSKGSIGSFTNFVARALKPYVEDGLAVSGTKCIKCNEDSLQFKEGCCVCKLCGWSKC